MFIVSSTSQMANYAAGFANSAHSACSVEKIDELGTLPFQSTFSKPNSKKSTCSTASNGSASVGGLRRSISSMHSSLDSYYHNAAHSNCSHSNEDSACIVEAKQVEMDFANLSNNSLQITVTAPNGENSSMSFNNYGETHRFCPAKNGCGHGDWEVKIEAKGAYSTTKRLVKENVFLDGVGSLFFTIDENMNVRLNSQEFLRLPSASRGCSRSSRKSCDAVSSS